MLGHGIAVHRVAPARLSRTALTGAKLRLATLDFATGQVYDYGIPLPSGYGRKRMQDQAKADVLKRLNFIDGHLAGIRRMVEADKYCVDVLKQTYAVRKAIEKMESLMLAGHLHTCVVEGIREGRDDAVLKELSELYEMAGK